MKLNYFDLGHRPPGFLTLKIAFKMDLKYDLNGP